MHFDYEEDKHNFTMRFDSAEGDRSVEMNFSELYIQDILWRFKEFLQGCGYAIDGDIQLVPWDEDVVENINYDFSNIPKNNWPFGDSSSTKASEK